MRICRKCGISDEMNDKNHHIIPKSLGGTDKDGRDILCAECHDDFHKRHYGIMLKMIVTSGLEKQARERTINYYKWWLENG